MKNGKHRLRSKRQLNLLRFAAVLAAFAIFVSVGYAGTKYLVMPYFFPEFNHGEDAGEDGDELKAAKMNLLLLGVDTQDGEDIARADSIIFVSADTVEQRVAMMSIPRDTRVQIPGQGTDKINSTTVYGGADLTRRVVSDLLGVRVPYHVVVDFDGFKEIVDILGGVNIEVERRMYYRDPMAKPPLMIDLQPGMQRLNGEKAMQYVRFRSDGLGDISRTQRQQKFLMALADEMMKPKNIIKLPKLVPELNKSLDTNLELKDMVRWAGLAKKINDVKMVSGTLPGTFWNSGGLSYWYVDPKQAKVAMSELMAGNPITNPIDDSIRPPAPAVKETKQPEPKKPETGVGSTIPPAPDNGAGNGASSSPQTPPPDDAGALIPIPPPAETTSPPDVTSGLSVDYGSEARVHFEPVVIGENTETTVFVPTTGFNAAGG